MQNANEEHQDGYGINNQLPATSTCLKYKVAFRRVYAAVTNVFPEEGFYLFFCFFAFLHIQNKWAWYISAYQSYPFLLHNCVLVIADRSSEWQPNSRHPPRGKCFSGNGGCVWGGYTRSEHWLAGSRRPRYELCSLCEWLLLECNSFVSKGWCAGQSSKVKSFRLR